MHCKKLFFPLLLIICPGVLLPGALRADHMPPIAMGEIAAGILEAGGPNVSGFLRMTKPKDPKVHGRNYYFVTDGSGNPVKWGSPTAKFIIDIDVFYNTMGTWSVDISSTYIATGEILNAQGSSGATHPPKGSDKPPVPEPRSVREAVKLAFAIFNKGRRNGKVLLRGGHTSSQNNR